MNNIPKDQINLDDLKAIILDFDGVIAESVDVKTEAFKILFKQFGEAVVKKVVKHHLENGGISRYKKIEYYYSEYVKKPLKKEELDEIANEFSKLVVEGVIKAPLVEGVLDFLERNYKKIDFYVASGTPQNELIMIIEKKNLKKYFKGVYGTPDTKPEIIKKIIEINKYPKEKILFIGDSISDYNDALHANIKFLGRVTANTTYFFPKGTPVIYNFVDINSKFKILE